MSESKHTPGPWKLESDAQGPCMVMHPTRAGVAIANLSDTWRPTSGYHSPTVDKPAPCPETDNGVTYHPERVANARLIAAAPDLLEVLERALEHSNCPGDNCAIDWHAQARVVIAKAKGETQ
jgi:hypothetical protein